MRNTGIRTPMVRLKDAQKDYMYLYLATKKAFPHVRMENVFLDYKFVLDSLAAAEQSILFNPDLLKAEKASEWTGKKEDDNG